jgi:acetoin utilization deacetylase AcuC-like enzyme
MSRPFLLLHAPGTYRHVPGRHVVGPLVTQHPEQPRRIDCLWAAARPLATYCKTVDHEASDAELARVHSMDLIKFVNGCWASVVAYFEQHSYEGIGGDALIDEWVPDTFVLSAYPGLAARDDIPLHLRAGEYCQDASTPIGPDTAVAARLSAGLALVGARWLRDVPGQLVLALCRPPGHHASRSTIGGSCYFNNAALAADALANNGQKRVALLDLDYHHGNGSQDIFYARKDVFLVSIHADPKQEYPHYWGGVDERGVGAGLGWNLNIPLPRGTGWHDGYEEALATATRRIMLVTPDYLVVSLGLDTANGDPLGQFKLVPDNYIAMGKRVGGMKLPTLVVLEGGYANDDVLGAALRGFLTGLLIG